MNASNANRESQNNITRIGFITGLTLLSGILLIGIGGCVAPGSTTAAKETEPNTVARKSIRFYSANKRGQEDRLALLRNTEKYGCQDLYRFRKAYRVAVIGFKKCTVYSQTGCPENAAMLARWDGRARRDPNKQQPTSVLTAGTSWILGEEGERKPNVPFKSWSCQ